MLTLAHWALDVPHDEPILVVQELHAHLCDLRSPSSARSHNCWLAEQCPLFFQSNAMMTSVHRTSILTAQCASNTHIACARSYSLLGAAS